MSEKTNPIMMCNGGEEVLLKNTRALDHGYVHMFFLPLFVKKWIARAVSRMTVDTSFSKPIAQHTTFAQLV